MSTRIENIEIKTTERRFFREYLVLKRPIINIILSKLNGRNVVLSDKLLQLLAELLYFTHCYSLLQEEDKWKSVFSRNTRLQIMEHLGLQEHYFNNYLSTLRRIKIIKDGKINKLFIVSIEDTNLLFKFVLNDQGNAHENYKQDNS